MSPNAWQPDTRADRGEADPQLRAALAAAYGGLDAYLEAIAQLCTARLILPTVEAPADAEPGASTRGDHDHDHDDEHEQGEGPGHEHDQPGPGGEPAHAPRAAVLLRSAAGEKGVLAFTGMDALRAWNPAAHPVRCTVDDVAATVAETESTTIVVDVAGPHQLVIGQDVIAHLAQGRRLVRLDDGGFGWMFVAGPDAAAAGPEAAS